MNSIQSLASRVRCPSTSTRHVYTLSTINFNHRINHYARKGDVPTARKLFDAYPRSRNTVSWNSLINAYIKTHQISQAHNLFYQMPHRDVVSWNIMLSGFRDMHHPQTAHHWFLQMIRHGVLPSDVTFSLLLNVFLDSEFDVLVPQLHGLIMCLGLNVNVHLASALMRAYISLGDCNSFCRVFDEMAVKDVIPWNLLILGFMEFGLVNEAQRAFDSIPKRNSFSWSSMINGYIKNKMVTEARAIFDRLSDKDVVSWTAMMRGCVQCEKYVEALDMLVLMINSGTHPNHYTCTCALNACAGCSSLVMGKQVHTWILKLGIPLDVVLATSVVDMYGKCGDIGAAFCVFESMLTKNLATWNSIIGGCARHGLAVRGLEEFERMVKSGVTPDEITFINVLAACVHGGLVTEGEKLFKSMEAEYGIRAEMEHYACMVDLYSRAGQVEEARQLIQGMPFEADVVVWGALLSSCGLHSCLEIGQGAANGLRKLEQNHPALYSMLSKMQGSWIHQKWHAGKQKAGSWIDRAG